MIAKTINLVRRTRSGLLSRWRNVYFKLLGVKVYGYVWLQSIEIPRDHHNIQLDRCMLDRDVVLLCNGAATDSIKLSIGEGTYINRRTMLDATESLTIGKHVAIGPGCYITDHDHGLDPALPPLQQPMHAKPTRIGDWAWLGANVVVLKGVTIGERTIVGAGSVVTRDLPPDSICAGVPARVIRSRIPEPIGAQQ